MYTTYKYGGGAVIGYTQYNDKLWSEAGVRGEGVNSNGGKTQGSKLLYGGN